MSLNELRQMVEDRLNAGEAMDSIKIDLRLNGIDIFEVLKEEIQLQEEVFDSITQMKQEGATSNEIDKHLEESYNIEKSQAEKLKTDLKVKGKRNKTLGTVLVLISGIIALVLILDDSNAKSLYKCIVLVISGISWYLVGVKQSKD